MTVFVHSILIFCFKFLFIDRLGPTVILRGSYSIDNTKRDPALNWIIKCSSFFFHKKMLWLIELGFHNYFSLKRYRFLIIAIFIASASTTRKSDLGNLLPRNRRLQRAEFAEHCAMQLPS